MTKVKKFTMPFDAKPLVGERAEEHNYGLKRDKSLPKFY